MFTLSTTYDASVLLKPFMVNGTAVGVKVDGGRIQPLYWNKQYATVKFSPKAKMLDFYVKTNLPVSWQRITVDLVTPKMTIYRKAAFPSK